MKKFERLDAHQFNTMENEQMRNIKGGAVTHTATVKKRKFWFGVRIIDDYPDNVPDPIVVGQ